MCGGRHSLAFRVEGSKIWIQGKSQGWASAGAVGAQVRSS